MQRSHSIEIPQSNFHFPKDSKVDKREVDVDHSGAAYLSNNLSGLSTRTWEERDSAEGWADDSAWDGNCGRESAPIAPAASDALDKIREMRQILEADPHLKETLSKSESVLKETLSKSESMSNHDKIANPYAFPRTSSNALDALRSVRMQLEANKDVAKAVSDTLHGVPPAALPPRSPSKGKRSAGRFFKKSSPNDSSASVSLPEPSSQSHLDEEKDQEPTGVEEENGDDISVASLVGPPPPPPPTEITRSQGSIPVRVPDESQPLQCPTTQGGSNPTSDGAAEEMSSQNVHTAPEARLPPRSPVKGKLSLKRFFKKRVSKGDPDEEPLVPQDLPPSEGDSQEAEDAAEGDVEDPSVEVVLKGYVTAETDEEPQPLKSRRPGVKNIFKKMGRKNRTVTPDTATSTDELEAEDSSGQIDDGENFPRLFSSDTGVAERTVNMNRCRADEEGDDDDDDDDSTGALPSSGFSYAANTNNKVSEDALSSRDIFNAENAAFPTFQPDTVDASDFVTAVDFDTHLSSMNIDVKDIERKMKQKRASDASISSSRGPASLAGTAGKKAGQLSSAASVKSTRTSKSVKTNSKNRQNHMMVKQKKPAIYHSGKLAGNAGTTQKGERGKMRDDNMSFTRWPQK